MHKVREALTYLASPTMKCCTAGKRGLMEMEIGFKLAAVLCLCDSVHKLFEDFYNNSSASTKNNLLL
jgi:hypothetical protein